MKRRKFLTRALATPAALIVLPTVGSQDKSSQIHTGIHTAGIDDLPEQYTKPLAKSERIVKLVNSYEGRINWDDGEQVVLRVMQKHQKSIKRILSE